MNLNEHTMEVELPIIINNVILTCSKKHNVQVNVQVHDVKCSVYLYDSGKDINFSFSRTILF